MLARLVTVTVACLAGSGCLSLPEPRPRTLAEFASDFEQSESAPIVTNSFQKVGNIKRQGSDYVILDHQYRTIFRLHRTPDGQYVVRDTQFRRIATIEARDRSGTRDVRDNQFQRIGTVSGQGDKTLFRDQRGQRVLATELKLD